MKNTRKARPLDYVQPELSPERVARMWNVVVQAQRASAPRIRKVVFAGAGLALGAAAVAGLLLWPGASPVDSRPVVATAPAELEVRATRAPVATGQVLETDAHATTLTLPDGSTLRMDSATRLAVLRSDEQAVQLKLERGRVHCDVSERPGRTFELDALDARVQVTHGSFRAHVLASESSELALEVERGFVEVRHGKDGTMAQLAAGQTWSVRAPVPQAPARAPTPRRSERAPAHGSGELPAALFEQANALRMAGHAAEAAAAYEHFRRSFPDDPRAALCAFEAGRIELDSLHDARGALAALRFAVQHARGGFVVEDAEALLVDALGRAGEAAACREALARFAARYPSSGHRTRLVRACSE